MRPVYIIAACRTPVAPRGGAFAGVELHDLGAAAIAGVLQGAATAGQDIAQQIDGVIMGSALCAGGNAARLAALAAPLPQSVPAITVDTQCCSGLDAIALAASRIASGEADLMIAGGMDSFSRAPIRAIRPHNKTDAPQFYERPPFSPCRESDPDLAEAAALLATARKCHRSAQEAFAIASHDKALAAKPCDGEIIALEGLQHDSFMRRLSPAMCARLPVLAGDAGHGLTAATIACEADAGAAVLLASETGLRGIRSDFTPLRLMARVAAAGDPAMPALAPAGAIAEALQRAGLSADALTAVELMEAYAVQAMANIADAGLPPDRVNRSGGALSRGHPIGASGAILAVRLFYELQQEKNGAAGLAAIAAAGGLASALVAIR
ncbi:MAG: acetyl-CoA C-acyltransferase [Alphaproteobacteria bacterium]|nr:acetyl-CoA C-acyltransferase [Alphaproteobacteria bacterium]